MNLPDHWLGSPPSNDEAGDRPNLLDRALAAGPASPIDYALSAPRWQFLQHAVDRGDIVLHGSSNPDVQLFEPRTANDVREFANRVAVYAAVDGIWPLFFAELDRSRKPFIVNAAIRVFADCPHNGNQFRSGCAASRRER